MKFSQRVERDENSRQACRNIVYDFLDLSHVVDGVAKLCDAGKSEGGDTDRCGGDAEWIHPQMVCLQFWFRTDFFLGVSSVQERSAPSYLKENRRYCLPADGHGTGVHREAEAE